MLRNDWVVLMSLAANTSLLIGSALFFTSLGMVAYPLVPQARARVRTPEERK